MEKRRKNCVHPHWTVLVDVRLPYRDEENRTPVADAASPLSSRSSSARLLTLLLDFHPGSLTNLAFTSSPGCRSWSTKEQPASDLHTIWFPPKDDGNVHKQRKARSGIIPRKIAIIRDYVIVCWWQLWRADWGPTSLRSLSCSMCRASAVIPQRRAPSVSVSCLTSPLAYCAQSNCM